MTPFRRLEFTSPSLSFGKTAVQVDVLEANSQLSPRVTWCIEGRTFYSTDCFRNFDELNFSAQRTAVYSRENGAKLVSPEHLAPVFLMWPSRRINVNLLDAGKPEIPMMDGCALPFFSAMRREVGTPEPLQFYEAKIHDSWDLVNGDGGRPYGFVRIAPSETFEVEYMLDRPELGLRSAAYAAIYSAEDLYHIFESRTFIFESEYNAARQSGLLSGVDRDCGLLLSDGDEGSNSARFRIADEPARHKILDLLGDITFVWPSLPRIRIEILNGGHASHYQILKKVLPYVTGYSA